MINTAILVDGAFYRKRAYTLFGDKTPKERADELEFYCKRHIKEEKEDSRLYRIFYYDCPPSNKVIYHPYSKVGIDLSKSKDFQWANEFYKELTHRRKFALRLGRLADEQALFNLRPDVTKKLFSGSKKLDEIKVEDFSLDMKQKGVDMRIGLDISTLAYKNKFIKLF